MITKKNLKIAKGLFKKSLDQKGFVDIKKVKSILIQITKEKPQGTVSILKVYKRLVENALSREEIKVESPVKIASRHLEVELLKKTGARKIIYQINKNLTFGARIIHGDWIWEETLDSKLSQLTAT